MIRPQLRRVSAFSIVEVIVAIGVLAVLLAILMPIMGHIRRTARTSECLSNLRQIGLVTQTIIDDRRGRFPFWISNLPSSPPIGRESLESVYGGHLSSFEAFGCPADPVVRALAAEPQGPRLYTSYDYWPGEQILDVLEDENVSTNAAISMVTDRFTAFPGAPVFFDREAWHPGEPGRNAIYLPDWHGDDLN